MCGFQLNTGICDTMTEYRKASPDDLERIWEMNINDNLGDPRWIAWREEAISNNLCGMSRTFVVVSDGVPVGEGTLIFSPLCSAIDGRRELADDASAANINALRIRREYEGQGHISALVRLMEFYAAQRGFTRLTIGVEAKETRNLAIYLHWGYNKFITAEVEDGELVLYYEKDLTPEDVPE